MDPSKTTPSLLPPGAPKSLPPISHLLGFKSLCAFSSKHHDSDTGVIGSYDQTLLSFSVKKGPKSFPPGDLPHRTPPRFHTSSPPKKKPKKKNPSEVHSGLNS